MMKQTTFLSGFTQRVVMWALFGFLLAGVEILTPGSILVNDAEARRGGHSATPHRAAVVPRRTTRRVVHRRHHVRHHRHIAIGAYVATLPTYCTTVITRGITYHVCDSVYYQPYYEGSELVYVVVVQP